jgi:hypothetical protein
LSQLAKHHRYKLAPATEALGSSLRLMFADKAFELMPLH